ncbi:hypothetical protein [Consotaella aegiceratis]|uniref:hypothetical protein n=1 Tax=Consotaella aegiceratis TaxID=3097961 RepID=UPI002F3FEFD3
MKPFIGITMGDVCGIGPEIVAKSLAASEIYELCRPIVVGDVSALERGRGVAGADFAVTRLDPDRLAAANPTQQHAYCVDPELDVGDLPYGHVHPAAGHAAFDSP